MLNEKLGEAMFGEISLRRRSAPRVLRGETASTQGTRFDTEGIALGRRRRRLRRVKRRRSMRQVLLRDAAGVDRLSLQCPRTDRVPRSSRPTRYTSRSRCRSTTGRSWARRRSSSGSRTTATRWRTSEFIESLGHTVYFVVGTVVPTMALGLGLALLLNSQIEGLGWFPDGVLPADPHAAADRGAAVDVGLQLRRRPGELLPGEGRDHRRARVLAGEPGHRDASGDRDEHLGRHGVQHAGVPGGPARPCPTSSTRRPRSTGPTHGRSSVGSRCRSSAPTTFFILIINLVGATKNFTTIFVMTNGGPPGPGGSTTTVVYWIYQTAFRFYELGMPGARLHPVHPAVRAVVPPVSVVPEAGGALDGDGRGRRTARAGPAGPGGPAAGATEEAAAAVSAHPPAPLPDPHRHRDPVRRSVRLHGERVLPAALQMFRLPPKWIPDDPTLANYTEFFGSGRDIGRWFFNSMFVTTVNTVMHPVLQLADRVYVRETNVPRS